jgi:glycosyltransferase involved in cell wall biosynthesis
MKQNMSVEEAESKYNDAFYTQHLSGSARSARAILGRLWTYFNPSSVLDVGCGYGAWLLAAQELGARDLLGLDGDYVDRGALLVDPSQFAPTDLRTEISISRRYDLALSVEVAEHLPMARAQGFVRDLCRASDVVLFSAATPYQGGEDHVNEQWPEYWGILFRQQKYRCFDLFRNEFWRDPNVESWYAQNVFLFVKAENPLCERLSKYSADAQVLSRVHPEIFLINVTRYRPDATQQLQHEISAWESVVSAYRDGSLELPDVFAPSTDADPLANPFAPGRLNYRDASALRAEVAAAAAASAAAAAADTAASERRLRDERNSMQNALIEVAVRLHERQAQEAVRAAVQAQDAGRHEPAPQQQSLAHVLKRAMPEPLRRQLRRIRDELDVRYLKSSGHFDAAWYLKRNPDVQVLGTDPVRHFVTHGVREGRNPRPDFDINAHLSSRVKGRWLRRNVFVEYLQQRQGDEGFAPVGPERETAIEADPFAQKAARAWYGGERLARQQLFEGSASTVLVNSAEHERQTRLIIDRFLSDLDCEDEVHPVNALAPLEAIREALENTQPRMTVARNAATTTYSIVTPFFAHLAFFRKTAESVARLMAATPGDAATGRIEWIVVNDDPRFDAAALESAIPAEIRPATRILSDGANFGISVRQNQGIDAARNEWILFLDCDDLIESHCATVLDHYIAQLPYCRFISSEIIDIDEDDVELRRRIRTFGPGLLYEKGMNAGHLAAIRRDLFKDVGAFDPRFSGCQDYDFALRTALHEPILLIPEHLYSYRWHTKSQSVGQFKKQARIAETVRRAFLQRFIQHRWPELRRAPEALPSDSHGACLIRTQGRRLELLEEAIQSVLQQTVPMTPCLIVHADMATYESIAQWARRFDGRVEVLHADLPARRRGYPLNVGLDFIEAAGDRFSFFCILDDDDIFYPMFAERLLAVLNTSGADVAYCTTNSRIPGQHAKAAHPPFPTAALVSGNFIPINAYIVRTSLLIRSGVRLREDIHYLEDWDFLLSLLQANGRFALLNETLSEFRIIGDGNVAQKLDPVHFAHCQKLVGLRAGLAAKTCGLGGFYRDLMDFDFSARPELKPGDMGNLQAAREIFDVVNASPTMKGH